MWHEVIILTARWLPFLYWTFWNYILNFFGVLYWLFFLCISTFCFLYYTLFGFYIILFSVFILNLFFIYSFLFYIRIFWKSLLYWKSGGFGLPYRRTRSSLIFPSLKPIRNARMVNSTRVPSHDMSWPSWRPQNQCYIRWICVIDCDATDGIITHYHIVFAVLFTLFPVYIGE
jgi:hypothetical protein